MNAEFSIDDFWTEVLEELVGKMSTISFDVWIRTLKPQYAKGTTLVVSSPSVSSQKLVEKNYKDLICEALSKLNRGFSNIEIVVEDQVKIPVETKPEEIAKPVVLDNPFDPKFTFENFVVGSSNRFAYAAAKAVADEPGSRYNPLFIYGGVGLGKTHLLHAIGNQIKKDRPEKKVIYTTTEKFTNELIESIQNNKRSVETSFRNKYRTCDVLIIDDIQFIISKTSTQEEFFHTFNELIQHGKQVVISSDKPPKEINPLEERLRSRFEMGLLSDIGVPDLETRIAILTKKAQLDRCNVTRETIEYIASRATTNIREMEGCLARTVFYADLIGKSQVTIDDAKEALKNMGDPDEDIDSENADMERVIECVSKYFNVSKNDLTSKRRFKDIVEARQICMFILCEYTKKYPLSYIGERFGRDHSTVIHAREKMKKDMTKDKKLKIRIEDIKDMIRNK